MHVGGGITLATAALLLGCATGGMGSSPKAVCQDRSRLGIPEGTPRPMMIEVESLVDALRLDGANLLQLTSSEPEILNRAEVSRALVREYPPILRDSGISGTARVTILVTEKGRPEHVAVSASAGDTKLDEAAVRVAEVIEFSRLRKEGAPICYLVSLPISFIAR